MQYDKECFSIGTFFPTKDTSLEDMLSFFETILGCSPQFLGGFKTVSVKKEETPVLYKQALRATARMRDNQEELFSIGNEVIWDLSYIGSKVQDVIEEDKGYGILSYNIADCVIYEEPQSMIQALGYTTICQRVYQRIITFEMQEKNYKLIVDVKPYFENEEGNLVVCGDKYWVE